MDGHKQIVSELSQKLIEATRLNLELKKKLTEAEGETSLVKAIGINSPEMKRLQEINKEHQKYNGELQMSLTNLEQRNIEIHSVNSSSFPCFIIFLSMYNPAALPRDTSYRS